MSEIENFNRLVDRALGANNLKNMRPVVAKELLHYDILFALEREGFLDTLTFQGGTCLRLCFGGQRFSEDLDFAGGRDFTSANVVGIKKCIEKYIGDRYGLEVSVKEPKDLVTLPEYSEIKVDKWQVRITTSPEKKDEPKQKIKLEIANIPAYSRVPRALQKNYEFLPDGYDDVLIMTESLEEIMADKIVAFVSCKKKIRYRDIWDLRWLKQQGAAINPDYILSKIKDYKEDKYLEKLNDTMDHLEEIIRGKNFENEMSRFIPIDVQERTLKKDKFLDFLINENATILESVKKIIRTT